MSALRRRPAGGLRRRLRAGGEDGFSLIEVIVAAALAVIVIGASADLFVQSNDSSLSSQRQAQLIAVADQQIEHIREQVKTNSGGFSALAMRSAPNAGTSSTLSYSSATHTDPNDFVSSASGCGSSNAGYLIEANYDSSTEGTAAGVAPWSGCAAGAEPLLVQSGGIVTPKQTVGYGSGTATVYEYVTETYVGCGDATVNPSLAACGASTAGDARRLIVAVLPDGVGGFDKGPNSPQYVSTIFTNPVPSNQVNTSIGLTLGVNIG